MGFESETSKNDSEIDIKRRTFVVVLFLLLNSNLLSLRIISITRLLRLEEEQPPCPLPR
jgi:hypothetical protein